MFLIALSCVFVAVPIIAGVIYLMRPKKGYTHLPSLLYANAGIAAQFSVSLLIIAADKRLHILHEVLDFMSSVLSNYIV